MLSIRQHPLGGLDVGRVERLPASLAAGDVTGLASVEVILAGPLRQKLFVFASLSIRDFNLFRRGFVGFELHRKFKI